MATMPQLCTGLAFAIATSSASARPMTAPQTRPTKADAARLSARSGLDRVCGLRETDESSSPAHATRACASPVFLQLSYPEPRTTDRPPSLLAADGIPTSVLYRYRRSARRAKEAGYDGVEIHAAHGGDLDRAVRSAATHSAGSSSYVVLLEIVDAVSVEWPPSRIGVRLSPNMARDDHLAQLVHLAHELGARGIAYLTLRESDHHHAHVVRTRDGRVDDET